MSTSSYSDIGIITENPDILQRVRAVAEEFSITVTSWKTTAEFESQPAACKLYFLHERERIETSELAQNIRKFIQDAKLEGGDDVFVIALTQQLLAKDKIGQLRKDGLHSLIKESEIYENSKLEFLTTQLVHAQYMAIKEVDLIADQPITFSLYHLMPLRNKFLKIAKDGSTLSADKIAKMRSVSEFYIHRSELSKFKSYTKQEGLESREDQLRYCRAQFLEFYAVYTDLIAAISNESETLSFDDGKELLENCKSLVEELADTLFHLGIEDVWDVVNNSSVGDFGSLERTTAIAAYASFFCMKLEYGKLEEIILAALVAQIGLIFLPPQITKKLRDEAEPQFTDEEDAAYRNFPVKSLDIVLSQRLPIEQEVKELILLCHEKADGSGFPKKVNHKQLTKHSQLLGFCFYFDHKTLIRMGSARLRQKDVLADIIRQELADGGRFGQDFLNDLKSACEAEPA